MQPPALLNLDHRDQLAATQAGAGGQTQVELSRCATILDHINRMSCGVSNADSPTRTLTATARQTLLPSSPPRALPLDIQVRKIQQVN